MYVSVVLQATNIKDQDACLDSIDYVHTTHCWLLKVWSKLQLQFAHCNLFELWSIILENCMQLVGCDIQESKSFETSQINLIQVCEIFLSALH
jgi:hypothetical protein